MTTYTEFHPRWYRAPMRTLWWARKRTYLMFILRELTSVFVAWFVVFMLLLIHAIGTGERDYRRFLRWTENPAVIAINVIALLFILYHMLTWFDLTPKAMVVKMRGQRVPGILLVGSMYAAWVVVSVLVGWVILAR